MIYNLILLITLILPSFAEAQTWPNAPANGILISDCNMSTAPCPGWFPGSNPGSVISDPNATASPPGVTAFTYNPSTGVGGGEPFVQLPNVNELYIGVYLWIDPNFYYRNTGHEKVFYVGEANGGNLWTELYAGAFNGTGNAVLSTVYQPAGGAAGNCHAEVQPYIVGADCPTGSITTSWGGPSFTRGGYHRLEVYYKRSTSSTSRDGVIRYHLDGVLVVNFTHWNFTTGNPFEFLLITQAWDGSDPGLPNANQWRYDHILVMSCSSPCTFSGTQPDTTPPAPVTGITVE